MIVFGYDGDTNRQIEVYNLTQESSRVENNSFRWKNNYPASYVYNDELVVFGGYDRSAQMVETASLQSVSGIQFTQSRNLNISTTGTRMYCEWMVDN